VAQRPVKNLLVPRPADRWTAAQKADLVLQVLRGDTTRTDACRVHALETSLLDDWVERFLAAGTGTLGEAVDTTLPTDELRTILDKIPTLVWRSDAGGAAELFNRRWLEYTGLSVDQAAGGGWTAALHPDDVARVVAKWGVIVASRQPGHLEARLRGADGTYRWFLFRAAPSFDADGNLVHWFGTNTDIEESKLAGEAVRQSERDLRLIVDCLPGLVCTLGADGEVETFNRRLLDYLGRIPPGMGEWALVLHPDDHPRVIEEWSRAMETGEPYECQHRLRGADGTYRWFHVRALPQRDAEGGIVRWYALLSDIEDRKRVERTLAESELELARVSRLVTMGELTASIAHEVNQPLSAVVNNANACYVLTEQGNPPLEEIREALTEIVDDAERASAVIARVRQLATKAPLERTLLDLRDVVADVFALARHESERRRVTLRSELPETLPAVLGDRVQLQQVLLNLVVNGMEASSAVDEPRRVLTVAGRQAMRDGTPEVVVSVRDAGVGVIAEQAAKLFEAFYTTKPEGMGMGLAISHSIIVVHGGRLWVEPNDGPGATFLFSLPEADAGRSS